MTLQNPDQVVCNHCSSGTFGCTRHDACPKRLLGSKWRHRERGSEYTVISVSRLQFQSNYPHMRDMQIMVTYRAEIDGTEWTRSHDEFTDGRFEQLRGQPQELQESFKGTWNSAPTVKIDENGFHNEQPTGRLRWQPVDADATGQARLQVQQEYEIKDGTMRREWRDVPVEVQG
jgi:hypothetical protein